MYLPAFALLRQQHGLITHRQLIDVGLTAVVIGRLTASERLVLLRRGVYADAETWNGADPFRGQPILRIRAARLALHSTAYVFSHDSASIVLGMGAPSPVDALVHVSRPKVHGDAVRAGVKHHLAPHLPTDVVVAEGLPVLSPVRTALDMAREHGRVAGLAGCDAALRSGSERHELYDALGRMSCWPHSRTMRWCIDMADPGAESYLESQGRDLVLELGIGRPETQFGLTDGRRVAWCDMRVLRHLFEIDGLLKYDSDSDRDGRVALAREKRRQDFISGFKLGVSRITAFDCGPGRPQALQRLSREYADTCARFGTSIADLAAYTIPSSRRRRSA